MKVPICGIRLLDEETGDLTFRAATGIDHSLLKEGELRPGEGFSGKAMQSGSAIRTRDLWEVRETGDFDFVRRAGLRGYLGVPLLIKRKSVGVLTVYTPYPHEFSEEAVDLLSSFGNQAAIAIENATLLQQSSRQAEDLRSLHQVSAALNSSLELNQVLEVSPVGRWRCRRPNARRSSSSTKPTARSYGWWNLPFERGALRAAPRADGLTRHVQRTRAMVVVGDALTDPRVKPELVEEGVRSILGMPLTAEDQMVGVLWLNSNATAPLRATAHRHAVRTGQSRGRGATQRQPLSERGA